jgi:hypothetical protein
MSGLAVILVLLAIAAIAFPAFWMIRLLATWYSKINLIIEYLKCILEVQKKTLSELEKMNKQ